MVWDWYMFFLFWLFVFCFVVGGRNNSFQEWNELGKKTMDVLSNLC